MNAKTELEKITSHDTADNFFWWIAENNEYNNIQGFELKRLDDGRVTKLTTGSIIHYFDIDYIWNERKMINDWITRILLEHHNPNPPRRWRNTGKGIL